MSVTRRHAVAAGLAAATVLPLRPLLAQSLVPLQFGDVSRTAVNWISALAVSKGFFERERLGVEITYTGNNAAVAQQVVGGSFDLGMSTVETSIRAIEQGAPVAIIGSGMLKFPYSFMADAAIAKPADLKGKKVILDLPTSYLSYTWKNWMKANNLAPGDVDLVYDGSSSNRFAALAAGRVSVACVTQPLDFMAADRGYKKLIDVAGRNFGFGALIGRKAWLAEKPEVARAFMRAMAGADEYFYDPKNRESCIAVLVEFSKAEPAAVTRVYEYYTTALKPFDRKSAIPDSYVQGDIDYLLAAGDFKTLGAPSKYVDHQFVS